MVSLSVHCIAHDTLMTRLDSASAVSTTDAVSSLQRMSATMNVRLAKLRTTNVERLRMENERAERVRAHRAIAEREAARRDAALAQATTVAAKDRTRSTI